MRPPGEQRRKARAVRGRWGTYLGFYFPFVLRVLSEAALDSSSAKCPPRQSAERWNGDQDQKPNEGRGRSSPAPEEHARYRKGCGNFKQDDGGDGDFARHVLDQLEDPMQPFHKTASLWTPREPTSATPHRRGHRAKKNPLHEEAAGSGELRMLRSSGDDRSQTQRGGMGWREAPDHAEAFC